MDQVTSHFNQVKERLPNSINELKSYINIEQIKSQFPTNLDEIQKYVSSLKTQIPNNIQSYYDVIKNTNKEELINDISQFKATPATITISITTLATFLILGRLLGTSSSSNSPKKSKKKNQKKKQKKKVSKAQKANLQIQDILNFVEEKYVPEIDDYLENYESLSSEQIQYKYTYFEEMLLKELMNLDGVDVSGNSILRDNRKKVIKFIQEHQKRLDKFKKKLNL